jgi:HPt (histidine-containing phosphotransfer) domain-containing protein
MNDREIQDAFLKQLLEDRQQIETAWNSLRVSKDWNENDRNALIRALHRLAGVALTVGYSRIGNAARRVENHLNNLAPRIEAPLKNLLPPYLSKLKRGFAMR